MYVSVCFSYIFKALKWDCVLYVCVDIHNIPSVTQTIYVGVYLLLYYTPSNWLHHFKDFLCCFFLFLKFRICKHNCIPANKQ